MVNLHSKGVIELIHILVNIGQKNILAPSGCKNLLTRSRSFTPNFTNIHQVQ